MKKEVKEIVKKIAIDVIPAVIIFIITRRFPKIWYYDFHSNYKLNEWLAVPAENEWKFMD